MTSLLLKGATEEVPPLDLDSGLFSHYFLIPNNNGGNFSLYKVQDADVKNYPAADSNRGLVRHYGPEGRLFPHPGHSLAQEVPQVCLWGKGALVLGPSILSSFGSADVLQVNGCSSGPLEAPGHPCTKLSR